jgi:negative regulator of genetic competence, sporulation and motility
MVKEKQEIAKIPFNPLKWKCHFAQNKQIIHLLQQRSNCKTLRETLYKVRGSYHLKF